MPSVYVILMHTGTIPSKLVKMATRYPYSHVGLSFEPSCSTVYSFGRRTPRNFINGGFVKQERDGAFFRRFPETVCRVYEIAVSEEEYRFLKNAVCRMEKDSGRYRYDFCGLFLRQFGIPVRFRNRFVCSQFVAQLLSDSGACRFSKRICMVKPKDFEQQFRSKEIYCGLYRSLKEGGELRESIHA